MLGAGALAGAAAVGVGYGRYAVGAEFENHVAEVLGIRADVAKRLIEGARERLGTVEYDLRANTFLASTTFPGADLLPRSVREKGIRPFLEHLMDRPVDNMIYLGLQKPVDTDACAGLIRRS